MCVYDVSMSAPRQREVSESSGPAVTYGAVEVQVEQRYGVGYCPESVECNSGYDAEKARVA